MVTIRQAQLQNLSGDVTGSGSSNDVVKLTGSTGVVNAQTARIANLSNPVGLQDAATKDYVDTHNGTLKEVLFNGNVTDGYDIVISNGDSIEFGGYYLKNDAFNFVIQDGAGSGNKLIIRPSGGIFVDPNVGGPFIISQTFKTAGSAGNLIISAQGTAAGDGGQLSLYGGDGGGGGDTGGGVSITAGMGNTPGGISILGGTGTSTAGGDVTIGSGSSGQGSGAIVIETGISAHGNASGDISLLTGVQLAGVGSGSGDVTIETGDALLSAKSGSVNITTGNSQNSAGAVVLTAGNATAGAGGPIHIYCGNCTGAIAAPGGSFSVITGDGYLGLGGGAGGDLTLTTGAGTTNGGNITVTAGDGFAGGDISIRAGNGPVGSGSKAGSVYISGGTGYIYSSIFLQVPNNDTQLEIYNGGIRPYNDINFYNEFSTPTITQDRLTGGFGQDGYELIIRAQDAGGDIGVGPARNGGCLSLRGGAPINGGLKGAVTICNENNPTADFSYISAAADYGLYLNAGIVSSGTSSLSVWAVDKVADIGSDNAAYNFLSFDYIYDAQILAGNGAFDRGRNIEIISGSGDDGFPGGDLTLQSGVLGAGSSDGYVIFKVGASEAARFNLDKTLHFSDGVNSTVAPKNFCIWGNAGNPYAAIACQDGYVFNLTLSLCDSLSNWTPTIDGYGGVAEMPVSTVTGAVAGDSVLVTPDPLIEAGIILCGWVSSDNTVTVRATNTTAETITMASPTTHRIVVFHTPVFPPPP
jgi:hypothetical protein